MEIDNIYIPTEAIIDIVNGLNHQLNTIEKKVKSTAVATYNINGVERKMIVTFNFVKDEVNGGWLLKSIEKESK